MYEKQGRSEEVQATAQLEDVQTRPPDLGNVFREYHQTVFRAAYRVTGNAGDAEDAMQSVFLRLLRRGPQAEAVGNMDSYLRRAAVNAALDLIRSRQAAPQVPLEDVAPHLRDNPSLSPDRVQSSAEIRRWLREAVARLNPRAAEMFALRYFEGQDNTAIAENLGTTAATVAVTLSRARDQIEKDFRSCMGGTK